MTLKQIQSHPLVSKVEIRRDNKLTYKLYWKNGKSMEKMYLREIVEVLKKLDSM